MTGTMPPPRRIRYATCDPEEAREFLTRMCGADARAAAPRGTSWEMAFALTDAVDFGFADGEFARWEFRACEPVAGGAELWRKATRFVDDLLACPGSAASPLLVQAAGRLLAATALTIFPRTAVTAAAAAGSRDARPATLRRAITFIHENARDDISLADIAKAARVSARAVQLAFRRHLDITPTEYLRRVRLECAHRELQAASPAGETVTAVAYRWGFASPSRFTARYRDTYGVLPSQTLRGEG